MRPLPLAAWYVLPAAIAGIATIVFVGIIYYGMQKWWPWAICYVENIGLFMAIKASEMIFAVFPEGSDAETVFWISGLFAEIEWWFPVGQCIAALSTYLAFWLMFHTILLIVRQIPFVKIGQGN